VAVVNKSGSAQDFARTCIEVNKKCNIAMILVTDSPVVMKTAVEQTAGTSPLLASATSSTAVSMSKIAKDAGCPLAVKGKSVEELAELSEKIKAEGVEDIVLTLDAASLQEQLYGLSRIRALALKKIYRPLGYPTIAFLSTGAASQQSAAAIGLACKYASIVALDTTEPWAALSILTTVMNIFSDPQKPVQVEPKVYAIGEPDADSPLMFTTNFSLTYYTVESDVEASRVPSYILVVDTEGTSVLTAYSGDKLNEKTVAEAMSKQNVDKLVKHRKLIIPGYVAVLSGKIEEVTGWQVMVGPRECSMLPKYLREVWV
jgi:acetyl-CoA decarbonylase/synthase complex subunit gamma